MDFFDILAYIVKKKIPTKLCNIGTIFRNYANNNQDFFFRLLVE